jgi:hypothetical protein
MIRVREMGKRIGDHVLGPGDGPCRKCGRSRMRCEDGEPCEPERPRPSSIPPQDLIPDDEL